MYYTFIDVCTIQCHLERLFKYLEVEDESIENSNVDAMASLTKKKVCTRKLLTALLLAINGNTPQKLRSLFELSGKASDSDDELTKTEFTTIVSYLLYTFHFPIRFQVKELKSDIPWVGINEWRRVTPLELAEGALATREKEMKISR